MADVLANALTWLAEQQKANCSREVAIHRGSKSARVKATLATQMLRTSDGRGNTKVERPDADFIITAADYDFNDGAGAVEPAAGDLIDVTYGTVTKRYKAMPQNNGTEPAWRYCDPHQIQVRVHTKFTGLV